MVSPVPTLLVLQTLFAERSLNHQIQRQETLKSECVKAALQCTALSQRGGQCDSE